MPRGMADRCGSTATSTITSSRCTPRTSCSTSGAKPPSRSIRADSRPVGWAKHHFWHRGYPVACPNPVLVGLHLASVTKNLRMGQSANILPDHHPVRLAEDIATADHLVKGRLDVGIARGTNSTAGIQFKREADRRDPKTNYRLFAEVLDIMIRCWTEDAMSHEGEFLHVPRARAGPSRTSVSTRTIPTTTTRTAA